MSEVSETPSAAATPAAPPAAEKAARPTPAKRPVEKRPLPDEDDVARWMAGEEVPVVGALFEKHTVKTFDGMIMQIRKDDLLPQHWQVISALEPPPDAEFDALAEVKRLAAFYDDPERSAARVDALRTAWRELRGKRPSLWTVPDLFAALRRIYDRQIEVDYYDLVTGVRDLWRTSSLPAGQTQLDMLWNCLDVMRQKTKK